MKVLIISAEVWRDDTNGGNVLSNIFEGTGYEFAQVYCNPGIPNNKLCKLYYQMTDTMMIKSIFKKGKSGKIIKLDYYPSEKVDYNEMSPEQENKKIYNFFRNHRLELFYVLRSIIWKLANWNNSDFESFILDFKPDIIFAPCYASHEMLAIDRFVKNVSNVPMISYISDDNYGLKQFRLSLVYWLNRIILRKNMRKTFKMYDLIYTMTEEQKIEYENSLHCKMKILKKSGNFSNILQKDFVNNPIRLIYAGGIYCGRWKTLAKIVEALKEINNESTKIVLNIYTGNVLTKKQKQLLNDGVNSVVHESISQQELKQEYLNSDIALHVESFQFKYKLLTRLSFSTKIIDCLESGCATMAICWNQHSGYIYLKQNDIAICIDSANKIKEKLNYLVNNPDEILLYAHKAVIFGKENHQRDKIRESFMNDFDYYVKENKVL